MDYNNPTATSFRDLGSLDSTIAHLKLEVCHFEEKIRKQSGESHQVSGSSVLNNVAMSGGNVVSSILHIGSLS